MEFYDRQRRGREMGRIKRSVDTREKRRDGVTGGGRNHVLGGLETGSWSPGHWKFWQTDQQ